MTHLAVAVRFATNGLSSLLACSVWHTCCCSRLSVTTSPSRVANAAMTSTSSGVKGPCLRLFTNCETKRNARTHANTRHERVSYMSETHTVYPTNTLHTDIATTAHVHRLTSTTPHTTRLAVSSPSGVLTRQNTGASASAVRCDPAGSGGMSTAALKRESS